ncbi:DUF956 family protein [Weissella diestrammenae]|uniref:DUF956 family protein n=1 Tax=Weissella diestrammenae TaxID=1162633 RepID=A0A7G9T444_9LACO|nr:DUF956 family protein [Weissella diestrammenae]MCM0583390.1 DUF956 family protein [Weissella diestrammenae]QNN74869.1 DUF956 family protein [Weissella diestrammenae]
MVQSLNTVADLSAPGIFYTGIGAKYGKILVGDKAFEFFNDNNVNDYIQVPWAELIMVQAQVRGTHIGRRFKVQTTAGSFDFSSKMVGPVLKAVRNHVGDERVLRMPSLVQKFKARFQRWFKKNSAK